MQEGLILVSRCTRFNVTELFTETIRIDTPPSRPPEGGQSFGHGAPASYQFRYSNCTGRRKALLIGINYLGQQNQLKGCINDVAEMSTFLNRAYGYRREDMVILTDDQRNPLSQPTKANILRAMQWLIKGAQPNDSLFFHYSGIEMHKSSVKSDVLLIQNRAWRTHTRSGWR